MLSKSFANGTRTWTAPGGELRFWRPAPYVLVLRFRGSLFDIEFARIAVMAINEVVFSCPDKVDIFHDWEAMELYTSDARAELTELGLRLVTRLNSLSVLTGSNLVEMGVTMAGIKLGGIRMFNTRADFEQAVRYAVESRGGTYMPLPPE
ncbi:hypothetical protein [Vitiosangium sp. GDMCC 1.1324]|uniref:hypothetical protein n=1 Tax=Vitiosangium sp. (strain GDMCC 1.1324) TaxID=2138576 RepID=UPI000D3A550D|nr:hypothetical protein [Vitiosangium sp. GDMCC 1.1324]PTL83306.1 hypothetical protein DAT35_15070 [Vitiosangium sp. GDMCC 1.1324]